MWIQKNQLNFFCPNFVNNFPKNISKITQKHVGKYNVKFTCPIKSKKNFNLFSHAQKIDEKILEIIDHFYIALGVFISKFRRKVQMVKESEWKK